MLSINNLLKTAVPLLLFTIIAPSCGNKETKEKEEDISAIRNQETEDLATRGSYLVTIGQCNDCHSPKIMSAKGMEIDSTRMLSGHPASEPMMPIVGNPAQPGNWILLYPDITAFVGPWGASFPANLTPDSATGLGAWTEETFIRTLRTGKHLGEANGRDILPPMPWFNIAKLKDEDLKSVFAFLRTLPPISNKVPAPLTPDEVKKLTPAGNKPLASVGN